MQWKILQLGVLLDPSHKLHEMNEHCRRCAYMPFYLFDFSKALNMCL